jgi:hypothetical protein
VEDDAMKFTTLPKLTVALRDVLVAIPPEGKPTAADHRNRLFRSVLLSILFFPLMYPSWVALSAQQNQPIIQPPLALVGSWGEAGTEDFGLIFTPDREVKILWQGSVRYQGSYVWFEHDQFGKQGILVWEVLDANGEKDLDWLNGLWIHVAVDNNTMTISRPNRNDLEHTFFGEEQRPFPPKEGKHLTFRRK